jgi:hypothetical protein
VSARQLGLEIERFSIAPDRFVVSTGFRERDRHVLEDTVIIRLVAEGKPIRRQGSVVIALSFEHERFVQIVEALRLDITRGFAAKHAAPPGHSVGIGFVDERPGARHALPKGAGRIRSGKAKMLGDCEQR